MGMCKLRFNENDDQERTQKLSLVEPLMLGKGAG